MPYVYALFSAKDPSLDGSFAENDLRLKTSYRSAPPCAQSNKSPPHRALRVVGDSRGKYVWNRVRVFGEYHMSVAIILNRTLLIVWVFVCVERISTSICMEENASILYIYTNIYMYMHV